MKFRKTLVWGNRSISNKRLRKPASTEHRDSGKVTRAHSQFSQRSFHLSQVNVSPYTIRDANGHAMSLYMEFLGTWEPTAPRFVVSITHAMTRALLAASEPQTHTQLVRGRAEARGHAAEETKSQGRQVTRPK